MTTSISSEAFEKKQNAKEWKIIQKQLITGWENHVSLT